MSKENLHFELNQLGQSINELKLAQSRLALMYVHESLRLKIEKSKKISPKTNEELSKVIRGVTHFASSIKKISEKDKLTQEEMDAAYYRIVNEYKKLNYLIRGDKVVVFLKDSLHMILANLGLVFGFALGLLAGALMVSMGLALGFKKQGFWGAVKDVHRYFATGLLQGMIVSKRMFTSIENIYDRQIRFNSAYLGSSLPNIKQLMNQKNREKIEHQLLTQFLGEGYTEQRKKKFLTDCHEYKLITMQAQFLSSNMKGSLGHHATLVYSSPIQKNGIVKHHIIEIGSPSADEIKIIEEDAKTNNPDQREVNQRHVRSCCGRVLLNLFVMHELAKPEYEGGFKTILKPNGFRAGYKDCHTYIDLILASVGEPLNSVSRVTSKENWVGRKYCALLERFSVFSRQPQMSFVSTDVVGFPRNIYTTTKLKS